MIHIKLVGAMKYILQQKIRASQNQAHKIEWWDESISGKRKKSEKFTQNNKIKCYVSGRKGVEETLRDEWKYSHNPINIDLFE